MEELPKKAKAVMGIYAVASTVAQGAALFFSIGTDDLIVIFVSIVIAATVLAYVYIILYFRHYKYSVCDSVIIIKKGALFKKRHLVYVDKISLVTVRENFVHRWFSLCTVTFYVQGTVVRLPFVPLEKSDELKKILDSRH